MKDFLKIFQNLSLKNSGNYFLYLFYQSIDRCVFFCDPSGNVRIRILRVKRHVPEKERKTPNLQAGWRELKKREEKQRRREEDAERKNDRRKMK